VGHVGYKAQKGREDFRVLEDHREFQAISEHQDQEVLEDFKALSSKLMAVVHRRYSQQVKFN
jgi:hypothetical protein